MCHAHVDELGYELPWSRFADEQPHLLKSVGNPGKENQKRNADGTNRVEVPDKSVTDYGHDQTEYVDNNIIAVVDLSQVSNHKSENMSNYQGTTYEEDVD